MQDPSATAEHTVQRALLRLIAQSRLVRQHAENGEGDAVALMLERRAEVITELDRLRKEAGHSSPIEDELFTRLGLEDQKTLEQLEAWRGRLKMELEDIASSRTALTGYSRSGTSSSALFQREL